MGFVTAGVNTFFTSESKNEYLTRQYFKSVFVWCRRFSRGARRKRLT